jgi:preprotein translocase subunit SecF|tara:strand:- start:3459 stop:3764 length:306 start_codon:yes stop_codon:yes gene_type:complete
LAKKRRLSKAEKQKRENLKWVFMFIALVLTIAVYLAAFIEADKTQSSIDFNKQTLVKLNEELTLKKNSVERMKRADIISKRAKEIGLVSSNPETIIIKIND